MNFCFIFNSCNYKDTSGSENCCNLCDNTYLKRYYKLRGHVDYKNKKAVTWYICKDCYDEYKNQFKILDEYKIK